MSDGPGSRADREDFAVHYAPLAVYFIVWLTVCSEGFERRLIPSALVLAVSYLWSHSVGVFMHGRLLLCADGPHTLGVMLPAAAGALILSRFGLGHEWSAATRPLMNAFPAFLLGHVAAIVCMWGLSKLLGVDEQASNGMEDAS